jgi:hypothetical protein
MREKIYPSPEKMSRLINVSMGQTTISLTMASSKILSESRNNLKNFTWVQKKCPVWAWARRQSLWLWPWQNPGRQYHPRQLELPGIGNKLMKIYTKNRNKKNCFIHVNNTWSIISLVISSIILGSMFLYLKNKQKHIKKIKQCIFYWHVINFFCF